MDPGEQFGISFRGTVKKYFRGTQTPLGASYIGMQFKVTVLGFLFILYLHTENFLIHENKDHPEQEPQF